MKILKNIKKQFDSYKKDYLILLSIYTKIFGISALYILNK